MQRPDPESLPLTPGVYLYKDASGRILYVGKARVLRRRVLSYFREGGLPAKTVLMLRHATRLDTLSTTTEKEALLLEASLIKKHRPRYNIVLRDDKQYVLFRVAQHHAFPRLEIVRQVRRDKARYFGPFTSAGAARATWKLLHRAFPLRRCTDKALGNRVRPCLYYHIGQCLAPCTGTVSPTEYQAAVRGVLAVLGGRAGAVLHDLEAQMHAASQALDFEGAATLRDTLRAVRSTVERQGADLIAKGGGDRDVLGLHVADTGLALGLLFVRGGVLLDGRAFFWHGLTLKDAPELLLSFPLQFYGPVTPPPRVILPWLPTASTLEDTNTDAHTDTTALLIALEQVLSDIREAPVRITAPRTPEEHRLVDMASANAREEARQRKPPLDTRLATALHMDIPVRRIECVDVSHTKGQQTRVGLVVFEDGAPLKSAYRTYTVEAGGDDHAALRAWTARRIDSGEPWPDLLLIDGGKGQLATVQRALTDVGHAGLFALASIAKARDAHGHVDRRAGNVNDRIFTPGRANPLPLREGSPELLFLQYVRDTAHRFALGRHRKARAATALSGELLRLPGVGVKTARLLWEHFESTERMVHASPEELATLPGIGTAKATALHMRLQALRGSREG